MNKKFRPQYYDSRRRLKWWRDYREYAGELNWQVNHSDRTFRKQGWPRVYRIGQHLHYLACHAPLSVRPKWRDAWRRFNFKYKNF
jgi:hypothetical protein